VWAVAVSAHLKSSGGRGVRVIRSRAHGKHGKKKTPAGAGV